ncbi:MAG: chromate resistance protein ChrB [Burkholderiales bacterium]|nr:chromate resistance protein ChrB [Burkholderiales bacterium]
MSNQTWLLLTYKAPPEPARRRIAVWRKLKGMGAVYLQNGVCMLPMTDEHVRRLKVVENEITSMGGEAVLLETTGLDRAQEEKILARFQAERDEAYAEVISRCDDFEAELVKESAAGKFTYAEVEENEEDLRKLQAWIGKIIKLDFTGASLRAEAEARVVRCETLLDEYAQRVFEKQHGEGQDDAGPSAGAGA